MVGDINIVTLGPEEIRHYCSFWLWLFEYHLCFCAYHPERVRRLADNTFGDIEWEGLGK